MLGPEVAQSFFPLLLVYLIFPAVLRFHCCGAESPFPLCRQVPPPPILHLTTGTTAISTITTFHHIHHHTNITTISSGLSRFRVDEHREQMVDVYIPRRSLYIMKSV